MQVHRLGARLERVVGPGDGDPALADGLHLLGPGIHDGHVMARPREEGPQIAADGAAADEEDLSVHGGHYGMRAKAKTAGRASARTLGRRRVGLEGGRAPTGAAPRRTAPALRALDRMDGDQTREALRADAAAVTDADGAADALDHGGGEQHFATEGDRLDAGGEVHRRADHPVLDAVAAADIAGDYRAHVDADAHGQLGQPQAAILHVERGHRALHVPGAAHRALAVVDMLEGRAEEHEDRVADELGTISCIVPHRLVPAKGGLWAFISPIHPWWI